MGLMTCLALFLNSLNEVNTDEVMRVKIAHIYLCSFMSTPHNSVKIMS